MMMIGGVVLATLLILVNMRKRRGRGASLSPREKIEQAKQTHAMRGDLRQMMVELEDLTRRFSAQLDAKSIKLEKLMEEADQKIARLQQLQADPPPASTSTSAAPKPAPAKPPVDIDPPAPVDPLARQIYQLADSGQSSIQIAKRLDEQIGKVELILALRQ
jgi:hypothetical protein